jgi:hypothetical protein
MPIKLPWSRRIVFKKTNSSRRRSISEVLQREKGLEKE